MDNAYTYCATGDAVRIYVLDTGVYPYHSEFTNYVPDSLPELVTYLSHFTDDFYQDGRTIAQALGPQCWDQGIFQLNASHGTAVASLAAGWTLGVAKAAVIVDARGLECNGRFTSFRATKIIDWICRLDLRRTGPSVINLSFSGPYGQQTSNDQALLAQISAAVSPPYNIPVVAAAGNQGQNVFWYMPGNAPGAITVAGLNRDSDTQWSMGPNYTTNYGNNVSFYAPAQYIEAASTNLVSLNSTQTPGRDQFRSELCATDELCNCGTSFAAALTSGVVARYLQRHPSATVDQVKAALQSTSATYSGSTVYEPQTGVYVPVLVYNDCP